MVRIITTLLLTTFVLAGMFLTAGCTKCPKDQQPGALSNSPDLISLKTSFPQTQEWDIKAVDSIRDYAQSIGSSALIIMHNGKLVAEWGDTAQKINSHSVRKSLLNSLIGIAEGKSLLNIDNSMKEINIDDKAPTLNATEKTATIRQLLMSRSGVYHKAAYESDNAKRLRPTRGQYQPGEYWYYNNWDFNVLGTIFERHTGLTIGEAFEQWIARPIGMQDFTNDDVDYVYEKDSQHPAYPMWISTRDLLRFGLLHLQFGFWNQQSVIPQSWIVDSTVGYSQTNVNYHDSTFMYGYLWWITPDGAYEAHGTGQQVLHVNPVKNIVISHRVDTCELQQASLPNGLELRRLIDMVLEAVPE